MPLSEHEQRLLEQMEQQLLSDDPRFASTMRGPRRSGGNGRRNLLVGTGVVVAGLALLVAAVTLVGEGQRTWSIWLGALAFLVMLGGILFAVSGAGSSRGETATGPTGVVRPDGQTAPRPSARPQKPGRQGRSSGTFMQRLEQRWDRRRDDRWG